MKLWPFLGDRFPYAIGRVQRRVEFCACRRRLAITLHKCYDWLQQCFMYIPTWAAKIILFHLRRGSLLK